MNNPPRQLPRFVPTLTEVVDPSTIIGLAAKAAPEVESMIELVRKQVQPIFERRIQEELDRLVRTVVTRQWTEIGARLHDEMDLFVRQVVIDAMNTSGTMAPDKLDKIRNKLDSPMISE